MEKVFCNEATVNFPMKCMWGLRLYIGKAGSEILTASDMMMSITFRHVFYFMLAIKPASRQAGQDCSSGVEVVNLEAHLSRWLPHLNLLNAFRTWKFVMLLRKLCLLNAVQAPSDSALYHDRQPVALVWGLGVLPSS